MKPPVCSNPDKTSIIIDKAGWEPRECNNFMIQGAWYCYADAVGTSSCVKGTTPYVAASSAMCLSGMTGTDPAAYGAAIGLELNSSGGTTSTKSAYNATTNSVVGFEVTITGGLAGGATTSPGSSLRLSFTTGPATTATQPYIDLPGAGTYQVLLADAAVASGTLRVTPSSIYDVQLGIPPNNGDTNRAQGVNYNYCITSLKPLTQADVKKPTGCTPTAYGPAVCGAQDLFGEAGNYAVQNNVSNGTGQCVQALIGGTCSGFNVTYSGGFGAGGNTPSSYPSIVYGWQAGTFYGGYRTAKQLSAITSAPTSWTFTTPGGGKWDAAYDVWFAPTAAPATAAGGLELMIWYNYGGGANPSGTKGGATKSVGGMNWNVWKGSITVGSATWQYIAYQLPAGMSGTVTPDIKVFANDAVNENVGLSNSSYLLGIQAGFEVWNSGGNMGTSSFTAAVN